MTKIFIMSPITDGKCKGILVDSLNGGVLINNEPRYRGGKATLTVGFFTGTLEKGDISFGKVTPIQCEHPTDPEFNESYAINPPLEVDLEDETEAVNTCFETRVANPPEDMKEFAGKILRLPLFIHAGDATIEVAPGQFTSFKCIGELDIPLSRLVVGYGEKVPDPVPQSPERSPVQSPKMAGQLNLGFAQKPQASSQSGPEMEEEAQAAVYAAQQKSGSF